MDGVSNLRKIKYQSAEVDIVNGNATFPISFETDRLYEKVKGIAIQYVQLTAGTLNTDFLKVKKFEIQNKEIYPTEFYMKHLETSNDVPFNKKFDKDIDEPAKSAKVDIVLKDENPAFGATYKVIVTLLLENSNAQH